MFWYGLALVLALTLLALAAAIAVCVRARFAGRAEMATATCVTWNALILTPIYLLGFASKLTAPSLACSSVVLSGAVLAGFGRGHARRILESAEDMAMLPVDALRMTWRAGSFAFLGLATAGVMIAWATFCVYWLPSWRGYDALWYHEPIVGFTIQTHGLRVLNLPLGLQKVNGYPKAAELTALWFVIFTDRRLIELSTCLAAPCLMLATYVLLRRFSHGRITSIGMASAIVLMPAAASELQSLYIDLHYAWLLVATVAIATRPVFRLRDGIFCAIAATLLLGTKGLALVPAPILLVTALIRLFKQNRERRLAAAVVAMIGLALVVSMLASVYWRNWIVFHNPFWPDLKLDVDKWNIHFPGDHSADDHGQSGADLNEDWSQFFTDAFSAPYSWHRWHYGEIHDYGFAVPWLIWPLGCCAGIALVALVVRGWLGELLAVRPWRPSRETTNAALIAIPLLAIVVFSPARWAARYHIGTTVLFMALCAWLLEGRRWDRLREGVAALAIVGNIASNHWSQRWWAWPTEIAALIEIPYPQREMTPASAFEDSGNIGNGASVTTNVGLARERELKSGDLLAYPDNFGGYVALFWNDKFSNRAEWIPEGPNFIENAKARHAKWIYLNRSDENTARLKADPEWEEVGMMNIENWGVAFRRVGAP